MIVVYVLHLWEIYIYTLSKIELDIYLAYTRDFRLWN